MAVALIARTAGAQAPAPAPPPWPVAPPGAPPAHWGYPAPPPPPAWGASSIPSSPIVLGRERLPYDEGDPVPPGYHVETRVVKGLVVSGLCIFGGVYAGSIIGASAAAEEEDGFLPLLVPIAGPFVTIGTVRAERAGAFWLIANGAAQTTGMVLLIAGLIAEEQYLARSDVAGPVPRVDVGPGGGVATWRF